MDIAALIISIVALGFGVFGTLLALGAAGALAELKKKTR